MEFIMPRLCDIYRIKNREEAFSAIERRYKGSVEKQNTIKENWTNRNDETLAYINSRIRLEICHDTINKLQDQNLMSEYKACDSVQNQIKKIGSILENYHIEPDTQQKIIDDYVIHLIPAGTKGVIRGNKFNNIIKDFITSLQLDPYPSRFEICFEKKCELYSTSEIPDWYILDRTTHQVILGMNQLDLWGGGHQSNRGSHYLENDKYNNESCKLLCVVCNEIQFQTKTKAYKLFEIGFRNNTLCYLKNLDNIIRSFFKL
jgi:hypothetical protein